MARKFLTPLRLYSAASNPTGAACDIMYNTSSGLVVHNGTTWDSLNGNAAVVKMLSGYYYKTPSSNSSVAAIANRSFYLPFFIAETTTIDRIACRTGSTFSGTATIRLGIYDDNNGQPNNLVLDAGTVSCTASSTTYQITISQSLSAGLHWLCFNTVTAATTNNFVSANQSYLQMTVGTSVNSSPHCSLREDVNVSSGFPSTAAYNGTNANTADVWIRKA